MQGNNTLGLEQEERLLLSCIRGLIEGARPEASSSISVDKIDWHKFLSFARFHRLSPLLAYLHENDLIATEFPEWLIEEFQSDYKLNVYYNVMLQGHLKTILTAFRDHDIQAIVMKGAALTHKVYPHIGLRSMRDIDILVRDSDVSQADNVLVKVGFEGPATQEIEDLFVQHHHHLAPRRHRRTGAAVDLHWQLARPDRPYSMDMDEMWANSQEISLAGVPCRELEGTAQLMHLCIHYVGDLLGKRTGNLRHLLDIALIVGRHGDTFSWADLMDMASRYQVKSEVFTALYISRLVLGVAYPDDVDAIIRPANFDELNIKPFIAHRVIGRGGDLSESLVKALASPGLAAKLHALVQMLSAPEPWLPGTDTSESERHGPLRSILALPSRSRTGLKVLISQGGQLRGQVIAERWASQLEDGG